MKSELKPGLMKFVLIFGFLISTVAVVIFLLIDPINLRAPPDRQLVSAFHAHREVFEDLKNMALEDSQHGWYLGVSDSSKIAESRQEKYKNLISQIRPSVDVRMDGHDDNIRFNFAGGGLLAIGPGWVKGIVYVPENGKIDGRMVANLDSAFRLPPNIYFRTIVSNWFIYYQKDE
jgi:hypothetical protein